MLSQIADALENAQDIDPSTMANYIAKKRLYGLLLEEG